MSRNRDYTNYSNMGKSSYVEEPVKEVDSFVDDMVKEEAPVPGPIGLKEMLEPTSVEIGADLSQVGDNTTEVNVPVLKIFKLNDVDALNVRVKPDGDIVTVVNKDETLTEMESTDVNPDWTKVKTKSGIIGFVKSEFITEF